ncbi:MAG: type II secretion system F family protein [Victivallaceae bacterium]|nr:type II secretion system F family protein [Victivallaceae bacterium]
MIYLVISALWGVAFGGFFYWVFDRLTSHQQDNLKTLRKPLPLVFKLSAPFLPLARPLAARKMFAPARAAAAPRLLMAGYGDTLLPEEFVSFKLALLMAGVCIIFLGAVSGRFLIMGTMGALLAVYPAVWLNAVIKKRHLSIMKALPNVLDLLTLSVESGRDLMSSLRDIIARRRMDPLNEELSITFQEIQLGCNRTEALRALSDRVRQIDLTSTVNAMIQAEELGVSIANLLRIQGDMQRNKRFALAEKMANEASVKIIIPVVLFILPAVFIILLGPLAAQAVRSFGGR